MKEKIKIMLSFLIFLFLFPYITTVCMQGISVSGAGESQNAEESESAGQSAGAGESENAEESAGENATGTSAADGGEEERERLISILAKEINVNSEEEAIKAQAVIVRQNYAYAQANGEEPEEGLSVQEMMSRFGEKNFSRSYGLLAECMDETADISVSCAGNMVMLPYHAVSAGKTRAAGETNQNTAFSYLSGVESESDISSENYLKVIYFEKKEFLAQLEQIFQGVSFSQEDVPSQLSIDGRDSAGYALSVTAGGVTVSGEEFRDRLGLNSSCFTVAEADGKIRIVTKGLGHGFGLSQWGANEMAKEGKSCIEILKYYFPNIEITE